jgi:hypothetical protein
MGLDMYLSRKTYVKNWGYDTWKVTVTFEGKPSHIDPAKIAYIEEEIGYWRKANQIHKWFVDNVQEGKDDCGDYYVSHENLAKLKDICQKVLDNPNLGSQLLPTTSGFFFGNTDYDQDYLDDLRETIKICDDAMSVEPGKASLYYSSSW